MESALRDLAPEGCRLIETMGYHPDEGIRFRDLHMNRLRSSAAQMGFPLDQTALEACLNRRFDEPQRLRLTLDGAGQFELTNMPLSPSPDHWRVDIAPTRLCSDDPFLRVKSTERALYDRDRATLPDGIDELFYLNERDEVCEGTITNIFVETYAGERVTPALNSGLLPGILRQSMLEDGWQEAVLTLDDLRNARRIMAGNALRGLIDVHLARFA